MITDRSTLQESMENRRAHQYFSEALDENNLLTAKIFRVLLILQWVAGILVSLLISPRTWSGVESEIHLHVFAAIILGGAISSCPLILLHLRPSARSTRIVVGVAQILWSGLLIHLTGGRIESHFHIFGSLALLAFFLDWRVLVTATVVTAVDHALRGLVWPMSIYGISTGQEWRFLEHAWWVLFEATFLTVAIFSQRKTLYRSAQQKASLESRRRETEMVVGARTGELVKANQELMRQTIELGKREQEMETLFDEAARQNQKLLEAQFDAETASHAKGMFLANMSHEIRTPMTAILGYTDLLLTPGELADEQQQKDALLSIERNGKHLLTIINDVLDMSKIEAGKMTVEKLATQLFDVVEEVVSMLRDRAQSKRLQLLVEIDSPFPETIQSDPTRLTQILLNLVGNAIKFTEEGDVTVHLGYVPERRLMRIRVQDTGIGMSLEQLEVVSKFDAFSQADYSMSRKFGGTGLGLRISNTLAKMLGGGLNVKSELGKGTTFILEFDAGKVDGVPMFDPKKTASPKPSVNNKSAGDTSRSSDKKPLQGVSVLLAEDGPDNQRLVEFILKKAGAVVKIVDNGQLAYDAAAEAHAGGNGFDVILMDMQMPIKDGYTATRELRDAGYSGTVIALTAHALRSDRQKCLDAGCDDYITKPIDRAKLIEMVDQYAQAKEEFAAN